MGVEAGAAAGDIDLVYLLGADEIDVKALGGAFVFLLSARLFGLGVAGGIHLVLREREEEGVTDVLGTSTPRAIVFSALTTIGSFGSIALSDHPGTSSMGVLLTIAITLTLGCTLVVLPALMIVTGERAEKAGNWNGDE